MAAQTSDLLAIEAAYRAGLARLGIITAYLTLKDWGAVSPQNAVATGGGWLNRTLRLILAVRLQSHRLATAYYQLARGAETGYVLGLPAYTDDRQGVSLDGLRTQFTDILRQIDSLGGTWSRTGNADLDWLAAELEGAQFEGADRNARSVRLADSYLDDYITEMLREAGDDTAIEVEDFTWPEPLSQEQVDRAFKDLLTKEALENQAAKAKKVRDNEELTADQAIAQLDKDHGESGSRGAGYADWAAIQAGRELLAHVMRQDKRVRGYARITGPNPCAFCSMLASRGFSYVSAESAGRTRNSRGEIVKYHPNCHCSVISRFVNVTDLPPLSAYYEEMWPKVTEDFNGDDKLRAWRQWLSKERRSKRP